MNTVVTNVVNEIVIEKSRFIAHIYHIDSVEEANHYIQEAKKKYWDASHNCSALILGENQEIMRSTDDGEPSGTAGIPILETLRKHNLSNVLCIVTRYFGGIKLGTGGLIRAYTSSVVEAIAISQIVKEVLVNKYSVTVCYTVLNSVIAEIDKFGAVIDKTFSDSILLTFWLEKDELVLKQNIENIINNKVDFTFIEKFKIIVDA